VFGGGVDVAADVQPVLGSLLAGEPLGDLLLDAVLALDRPQTLAGACEVRAFSPGQSLDIGPFRARTWLLPHWLPNASIRLTAGGTTLAYTGDSGPAEAVAEMAGGADLLLAEATYAERVPGDSLS
jgi:Cft2 family RNA processing exonuclease